LRTPYCGSPTRNTYGPSKDPCSRDLYPQQEFMCILC